MKTLKLKTDQIYQNENSRVTYKEHNLAELMASMKRDGLLQPIGVRKLDTGEWECVYGNCRLVAARKLEWDTIDAIEVDAETDLERDALNLIENIKRQNTSASEEGRTFLRFRDAGLSDTEIAARLGISVQRVRTAMELYEGLPKELRKKITTAYGGGPHKGGRIPASSAHRVLLLQKRHRLTGKQTEDLMRFAGADGTSVDHLSHLAPLIAAGTPVAAAMKQIGELRAVSVRVLIPTAHSKKLERKYKKTIARILEDRLASDTELRIRHRKPSKRRTRVEMASV